MPSITLSLRFRISSQRWSSNRHALSAIGERKRHIMTTQRTRVWTRLVSAIAVCGFLFISTSAFAQKYVRAGASGSGSGSDWTNAYTELNKVSFSSGVTVYVAAGTYNTGFAT